MLSFFVAARVVYGKGAIFGIFGTLNVPKNS